MGQSKRTVIGWGSERSHTQRTYSFANQVSGVASRVDDCGKDQMRLLWLPWTSFFSPRSWP